MQRTKLLWHHHIEVVVVCTQNVSKGLTKRISAYTLSNAADSSKASDISADELLSGTLSKQRLGESSMVWAASAVSLDELLSGSSEGLRSRRKSVMVGSQSTCTYGECAAAASL